MKKKGFTLVELMVSMAVMLIIVGSIGLVMTSFSDTYNMGMKNEETGNSLQTFYAYLIRDITPEEEEDEENFIEVKSFGSPMNSFEIRRSWHLNTEKERVRYVYSSGELNRYEYRNWDDNPEGTRILKSSKNFDFTGIEVRVSRSPLEKRKKITSSATFERIEEDVLTAGTRLGYNGDDEAERYNYYIEPAVLLKEGSESLKLSRGYGFRFAPPLYRQEEDDVEHDNLIWCEEYTDIDINGSIIFNGRFNSPETGSYIRVVAGGDDADKIHEIKVNDLMLDEVPGENDVYEGYMSFPHKTEIQFFINVAGNNRSIDLGYYVYKDE